MANTRAEAFAPASMGNVGIGFDILGLAYEAPGDRVIATFDDTGQGAFIASIEGDGGVLPYEADQNVAAVAANALLKQLDIQRGIALTVIKGMPLSSGLGGSAASSVAAVVAVNALLGKPLSREALLPACLEGEASVSGYHADNIAPCLLGGITLITGTAIEDIQPLPVPDDMYFALVTPDVRVPTAEARAALPKEISLKKMIHQTAMVAALVDALHRGDVRSAALAMASDEVVEPARAHLMPKMAEVREAALEAGAYSLCISGAGPTLCAVTDTLQSARTITEAMKAVYEQAGIGIGYAGFTKPSAKGAYATVSGA